MVVVSPNSSKATLPVAPSKLTLLIASIVAARADLASLALATVNAPAYLQVIWACAIVFVIARLAFWFGYRRHPLLRAPGMAATSYLNLGMILYVLYAICVGA